MFSNISWMLPSATPMKIKQLIGIVPKSVEEDPIIEDRPSKPYINLVVIGCITGKTSLCRRFVQGSWSKDEMVTTGASFTTRKMEVAGQKIACRVWDTCGVERYRSMLPLYCRGADGVILVYDITYRSTFDDLWQFYKCLDDYAPPSAIRVLVGTKLDLESSRQVSTSEGQSYASQMKSLFFETSAKTGANVTEVFCRLAEAVIGVPRVQNEAMKGDTTTSLEMTLPFVDDIRVKFLLLGRCPRGKRHILQQLSEKLWPSGYQTGRNPSIHVIEVARRTVRLMIWDTADQDELPTINSSYLRGVLGVFLVYDVSDRKSFEALPQWYSKLKTDTDASSFLSVLVGTKPNEKSSRRVSTAEAQSLASGKNSLFFDSTADATNGVAEMFQDVIRKVTLPEVSENQTAGRDGTFVESHSAEAVGLADKSLNGTDGRSREPGPGGYEQLQEGVDAFMQVEQVDDERRQQGGEFCQHRQPESTQDHKDGVKSSNKTIEWLKTLIHDETGYKNLLALKGCSAQTVVNLLQELLDSSDIQESEPALRKEIVVTLQKLANKAEVYPSSYQVEEEIVPDPKCFMGAGGFGEIYKCQLGGRPVCVKVVKLTAISQGPQFMRQFLKEAILWAQLSHPNIVPFQGFFYFSNRPCLVSPWMGNGHINDYLQNNPSSNRYLLVKDMTEGLHYLHSWGIVHGDLKGANVIVDDSGRACLTDFGISSVFDSALPHWTSLSKVASRGGSTRWQAPELLDSNDDQDVDNTRMSDVYAWGCTCYEIFTAKVPFYEIGRESTVMLRIIRNERPSRPSANDPAWLIWGLEEQFWSLMERCWERDPKERPSVEELLFAPPLMLAETLDDRPPSDARPELSSHIRPAKYEPMTLAITEELQSLLLCDSVATNT